MASERDRSPLMQRVDEEVECIWGKPAYSRRWIRHLLDNWLDTFETENADRSFYHATIKADLWRAVRQQPVMIRLFFQMFCLEGLTFSEIRQATGWSAQTCIARWNALVDGVAAILCDNSMRIPKPHGKGPIPKGYAYTTEGKFDLPMKKFSEGA